MFSSYISRVKGSFDSQEAVTWGLGQVKQKSTRNKNDDVELDWLLLQ